MIAPSPRDALLVSMARTPVGRFNGALRGLEARDLGAAAVSGVMSRAGSDIEPDHIVLANVVQAGNGQNPARVAAIRGGLPTTIPGSTLNDVCVASMTSVSIGHVMIGAGRMDVALVGGFESMSRALHGVQVRQAAKLGVPRVVDLLEHDGLWCAVSDQGMGEISDRANADLDITRIEQDEFALLSQQRAAAAQRDGAFDNEIVPLPELSADEGVRPDTSAEKLANLKPAFGPSGTITAGNASQLSDAGAAGLMTSRELAQHESMTSLAHVVDSATIAGPDPTLHLKPAVAARQVLQRQGLSPRDIGVWEINEAFAGVVIASMRDLEISPDDVNIHGGAIALGHPLGASGFRITMALITAMESRDVEWGVAAMCGGGGQGAAVLLHRER